MGVIDIMMDNKTIFSNALKKWGIQFQVIMLGEEFGELFQAISKALRAESIDGIHKIKIAEEIADVEVMLAQMKVAFDIPDTQVDSWRKAKIENIKHLLERGKT